MTRDNYVPTPFETHSRRSTVYGTHGMVASFQPLATQAGIDILKKGGNAADAAVAVAACLTVTEPMSTGIGGDCFALFYSSKDGTVQGLNGSGRSPAALTREKAIHGLPASATELPTNSVHGVTVPGAAAGWADTVEWFGSGKLTLKEILEPAIKLAEEGYPVSLVTAEMWRGEEQKLKTSSKYGDELLFNGRAPREGELVVMPNFASVLRDLAEHGKDAFYQGKAGQAIVDGIQELGGVMTMEDLRKHESKRVTPISIDYNGCTLYEIPPNGQGITVLQSLGIIDALQRSGKVPPLDQLAPGSPDYLHVIIETLRLAFADSRWFVADPEHYETPVKALLNKHYLEERAALIDPNKTDPFPLHGLPVKASDTVFLSVVDEEGNACSFINSLYEGFGSGIVAKECGFALQNRGCNFSLDPENHNCIAPAKRPYHTIIPGMAIRKDINEVMSFGVVGGFMQAQGQLQVLLNLLHRGWVPQRILDFPRICLNPATGVVSVEEGIDAATVDALRVRGHNITTVMGHARKVFGRGQMIIIRKDANTGKRILVGGSDMRADGQAAGW
ncbi:gamma-glutamyltranspeptidase [Syncephalis plumigaleata]|nr:gamma-glutamyltranspeptidase [Syncephalis plumigaleata]